MPGVQKAFPEKTNKYGLTLQIIHAAVMKKMPLSFGLFP
jgi:hypothetical protein